MNTTDRFLSDIHNIYSKNFPSHVIEKAKRSLLDYIAVTFAGSNFRRDKVDKYVGFINDEKGYSTAIGMNGKYTLKDAVFLNGLNAHALDYDDGTNAGIIHLGSPIFSVLLPLAEKYHISSEQFFKAAIIGYETSFTMALSIQPKHKQMGYHATGTCGLLGGAMAVSYMLDFTPEQRKNAFEAACASATGFLQVLDNGSELKPYNVAKTALLGLVSAQMAKSGFVGNPDALGSYRGFLKMMAGDENLELEKPLQDGLYAIERTYTKPYAACRYCHPSIDAAIQIKRESNVEVKNIKAIEIKTYDLAVKGHEHTEIQNSSSAKMSIPYSVACALIYGKAGLNEYSDECVNNTDILELTRKIHVESDDELSVAFPEKTTAILTLQTNDGEKYEKRVDFPKGEPENPLSDEEFNERFMELSQYGRVNAVKAKHILDFVYGLNDLNSMDRLFKLL